ncbi:MAG: hypothetical protein K6E33_08065 [Lachnospiraceae bacterium]|nr:hypothetical protein [Lachnospiraceae bacterium]
MPLLYQKNKKNKNNDGVITENVELDDNNSTDPTQDQGQAGAQKPKKSILHKQLGSGGAMPTKRYINLYMPDSQKKKVNVKGIVIGVLYVLAVLAFVKIMILNTMDRTKEVKNNYQMAEDNLNMLMIANQDFEEVLAQYSRFGNNFMKPDELAQRDRMEILDLINRDFMGKDGLMSVNISGNAATMEITSELLADVSSLVKTLEEEPIVYYVTISRAETEKEKTSTGEEDTSTIAAEKDVSATLTVYFKDANASEEGTEAETAAAEAADTAGGN